MKKRSSILSFKKRKGPYRGASRSQALLEFALALPILLMLLFGIIDLAALFQAWLTVENIARQTVRYAVTGQYDPVFCVDYDGDGTLCAGDSKKEEEDYARLLSVQEYADRQTIALFRTTGAAQDEIGHLNITICSDRDAAPEDGASDYTFIVPNSSTYSDCLKNGVSDRDAGGPGDRVYIAVDFNHPYITPILNQIWPWTHLSSHREGIVEEFRVPRLVALSDDLPSRTPRPTNTATEIPNTATATSTPLPLYIEIINPDPSGMTVTSVDQTRFEAIAWDPNIGTSNGDGISEVEIWFRGPGSIPGRTDGGRRYCPFGGNGNSPCNRIDAVMDFTTLPGGPNTPYTMFARARGNDGRLSETVSKIFYLNFPPTPTPTITNTPTATPIPSCNDVFITNEQVRDNNNNNVSDFRVTVLNNNQASGFLINSVMTWDSPYSPPMFFDFFWFLNSRAENRYYNPGQTNMYDYSHSPISWSNPAGAPAPLIGEAKTIWGSRFNRQGEPALSGNFHVELTFFFPDLGNCLVSTTFFQPLPTPTAVPPTNTPITPTPTPICNITGAITTTDFNGDPQNVNGYNCAYGCIHSPYLQSNNLPPGNYFWTIHTVGNPVVQVNNGTFTLNPGQQAGPPSGVVVPLGLNMYNIPPNYFPGEFKVSVFQSTDPSCNAKTDNFKIQSQFPSPTPTKPATITPTKKPTSTPQPPTDTPTPSPTPTFRIDV